MTITRVVGVLLALAGALALVAWLSFHVKRRSGSVLLTWALSALAAGVAIELKPVHGLPSITLLLGGLLVCHGIATSWIAFKGWRARDVIVLAASFAAPVLVLVGLALLFGIEPGERGDEIMIGVDMVLFGLYLLIGRTLIGISEDQADQGARQGRPRDRPF